MIRRVTLSEFRGFKKVSVGPFQRVSLVLGRNNTGKSTLLEALFLLSGPTNPELPLRLSGLRGVEQFRVEAEELWGWLFHQKKTDQDIELTADLPGGKNRNLIVRLVQAKSVRLISRSAKRRPSRSILTASSASEPSQLELRFRDETGNLYVTSAVVKDTGLEFQRDKPLRIPNSIFVTGRSGYTSENAERFSKLEEVGKQDDLLPALRHLEPRLKRLAVLVTSSGPVIHGDIGLGHMVPMHFMGEGIGRLMTILLAITESPKGMALIDEVEMGLHYTAMVETWRAINELARQYEVQVVATTHNFECLRAAHEVFSGQEDPSFSVHRLDRQGDEVKSTHFTMDMIEIALRSGLEMR